jgi:hypothetical protein
VLRRPIETTGILGKWPKAIIRRASLSERLGESYPADSSRSRSSGLRAKARHFTALMAKRLYPDFRFVPLIRFLPK